MTAQLHTSTPETLGRRTLARDHRRLAALLRPGMRVLDVGCGTGAITVGIARAVAPTGSVLGIDRDATLLQHARALHAGVPGLRFDERDVLALEDEGVFDVASAARVLQWTDHPAEAVARMARAVRPGGCVVALDYSHADTSWEPAPPPEMGRFVEGFLAWREAHGWDNRMAHRLASLCTDAGLVDVEVSIEDETTSRGEDGFDDALHIWQLAVRDMGPAMIEAGVVTREDIDAAARAWERWRGAAARQRMVLRTVVARRPKEGRP